MNETTKTNYKKSLMRYNQFIDYQTNLYNNKYISNISFFLQNILPFFYIKLL